MEQNVSTDKNFLRNILVTRGDPFVCACPRMRRTHCRQAIVERSSLYFWSIWEQHVFSFIIVHLQTKIYEVLKRASVHLPVVVHYWTGTTTNSTSLVLKKVRIKMFYTRNLAVKSSAEDVIRLHSPSIRLELPACRGKGCKKSCCEVSSGKQRRKNLVTFTTEVVDSLLWVERHPGTVTGLPPKERLQT